jgi:hypothetical protein
MGAYTCITQAPWRVEAPLQPIGGESLDGFIARVAAANWIENTLRITSLAGVMYGHKPTLATHGWEGLPILADCLQIDVEELRRRSYPAVESTNRRQFFGADVERRDIETRVRRFAPAGLEKSPHHRALWQLRPFPFCSETWQYLLDRCPRCEAVQRWYHTNGVERCDRCVEELSIAPAEEVPLEERAALSSAIGLVHPDPVVRERSLLELPPELQQRGATLAFELLVRLMALIDEGIIKSRVGKMSSWSLPPAAITSAASRAWPLLKGWPQATQEFMAERISTAATRHNDGNKRLSLRFLNPDAATGLSGAAAEVIRELRESVDLDGPRRAQLEDETMGIKQAAATLGRGTKQIADIRRHGALNTVFTLKGNRPVARFETAEIRKVAAVLEQRVGLNAAAWRFGVAQNGALQLVAMNLLETDADRYCLARYGARQTTETAVRDFEDRLQSVSVAKQLASPISLRNAAMGIGGRLKPWGPMFDMLVGGAVPFTLEQRAAPLTERLFVDRSSVIQFLPLQFDPADYAEIFSEDSMSRIDAGEVLNLHPRAYTDAIRELTSSKDAKLVRVSEILAIAETHISAAEIGVRLGTNARSAYFLAGRSGVPLLGPAGWCRKEVERLIFDHAA